MQSVQGGLSLFCDNLRCDLLGTSVRVSEIVPGRVQTDLYKTALGAERAQAALYEGYRTIRPEHIARLIATVIELPTADVVTPLVTLSANLTQDVLAYPTYSEGYRSGGFPRRLTRPVPEIPTFGPESVESYEVGIKGDFPTNHLRINAALFRMDYTDVQAVGSNTTVAPPVPGIINAGDAQIEEAELEITALPSRFSATRCQRRILAQRAEDPQPFRQRRSHRRIAFTRLSARAQDYGDLSPEIRRLRTPQPAASPRARDTPLGRWARDGPGSSPTRRAPG